MNIYYNIYTCQLVLSVLCALPAEGTLSRWLPCDLQAMPTKVPRPLHSFHLATSPVAPATLRSMTLLMNQEKKIATRQGHHFVCQCSTKIYIKVLLCFFYSSL